MVFSDGFTMVIIRDVFNNIAQKKFSSGGREPVNILLKAVWFFCEKSRQGYKEETLLDFLHKGIQRKEFKKYLYKAVALDREFDADLMRKEINFDYIFMKYLEFEGGACA